MIMHQQFCKLPGSYPTTGKKSSRSSIIKPANETPSGGGGGHREAWVRERESSVVGNQESPRNGGMLETKG